MYVVRSVSRSVALSSAVVALAVACGARSPETQTTATTGAVGEPPSAGGPNGTSGPSGGASSGGAASSSTPGAATGGSGTSDGDTEAPPVPYQHFDVNHILSTGQSNAVANDGKPVLSTTQPYGNLMFDSGIIPAASCDSNGCSIYQRPTALVPLVEGDTFFYAIETMSAGLANEASKLAKEKILVGTAHPTHDILVSLHGRSGNSYSCLRKGGCAWWPGMSYVKPFDDAMMEVTDALALSKAAGKSYVVRAATAIHGEHDHYAASDGASLFPLPGTDGTSIIHDYGEGLEEWQRDYESSVKAITGQSVPVPLFVSQYSHWNNVPTTVIAYEQLAAHVRSKGKVIVVGPTYVLPYSDDCLHFTGHGERHLGEYFAKAYARVVLEGRKWEPLRPKTVTRAGNVVTAKFVVPKPPLVIDTQHVTDPGSYGFEFFDDSGAPPAITAVTLSGPDTVTVTLARAPLGGNQRLRYAYTFHGCGGSGTIARGNLRDSDDTPSQYGYDLWNWAVHFDEPVP
ncbi:MAG: hypothetical protein QOI41_3392 [Myxococcales bacterium]|nr:hypothetical protein [Myxococcales bacterium]